MSLHNDPEALRAEIARTAGALVEKFRAIESRVMRQAAEVSDKFERASNTLKGVVDTMTPSTHIRKSPYLSVGLATGAGVLAGRGRRGRRRRTREATVVVSRGGRIPVLAGLLSGGVVYLLGEAGKKQLPRAAAQIEAVQNALLTRIAQSLW